MRRTSIVLLALVGLWPAVSELSAADSPPQPRSDRYWPQWRGPLATGAAPHADPPVEWSEERNVAWKREIPGKGSSTPVVWGDRIFVLTAIPTGEPLGGTGSPRAADQDRGPPGITPDRVQDFSILAIHRDDGRILWRRTLRQQLPHEGTHPTGTWASASPVTDGRRVWAFFGSHGLYCLDMVGKLLWEKDLGDMRTRRAFGEGSSPALFDGKIVVNWDHEGQSFIVVLDAASGREIWRRERDEITSWSTPLIVEHGGRRQVITSATRRVRSYDLDQGELLWESAGMTVNTIPSPVAGDGLVIVTSGFRGNALLAIRLDGASGDLTDSRAIVWRLDRDTPYTPSPLLYDGTLYLLKSNDGIVSSFDAATGERHFGPVRLPEIANVYASPAGAAGRVYIAGREGTTVVLRHGEDFEVLAVNRLGDGFDASPVLVDSELYLRGRRALYRISRPR